MLKGLLEVDTDVKQYRICTELTKWCQAFQHCDGRYSQTQVKKKIQAKVSNPQTRYLIQQAAEVKKKYMAAITGKQSRQGTDTIQSHKTKRSWTGGGKFDSFYGLGLLLVTHLSDLKWLESLESVLSHLSQCCCPAPPHQKKTHCCCGFIHGKYPYMH